MIEIRLLLPGDDRRSFRSGDAHLDRYFQQFAGQNQFRHRIGANYVAVEEGSIVGYATVAPGEVQAARISSHAAKRLPAYPIPILRLARLAIDAGHRDKGIGEALLRYVFSRATEMSRQYGCAGVVVDAKPAAVSYYERYGFRVLPVTEGELREAPIAMYLSIHAIPGPEPTST